ncbi:MAG: hypothetical protein HUJ75_00445, partial [Parasporobacterium sp.]|nr:hypothetical protein [Parasporobacterium sp.]
MEVTLSGGSGKAKVESPCTVTTDENGQMWATVVWSSSKYEFMVVDGVQYDPITIDPGATFVIPVTPDTEMAVQAQTTAMSTPHLVDYTLFFDSTTLK